MKITKKLTALLLLLALVLGQIPVFSLSGGGTAQNPYTVSSAADLLAIHNDLDGYYILTADIDMAGVDFEPIGNETEGAFTGTIDGGGHTIYNLDLNLPGSKFVGLVGCLEGTVKNLALADVEACGYKYVGAVAGYVEEGAEVVNCAVSGHVSGNYVMGDVYVGGLVGYSKGSIEYGTNACEVINNISNGTPYAGGMAGYNIGTISYCTNNGNVSSNSSRAYAGGMTGTNNGTIRYCSNYKDITVYAYFSSAGGIGGGGDSGFLYSCVNYGNINGKYSSSPYSVSLGGISASGTAFQCMNYGNVDSPRSYDNPSLGGIVARGAAYECANYGSGDNYFRGITSSGTIKNCISLGYPLGGYTNNPYIGTGYSLNISDSFNICEKEPVSGSNYSMSNVYGITELSIIMNTQYNNLTHMQFSLQDSFNLDFENTWFLDPATNSGFPQLRNMPRHIDLNECVLLMQPGETASLRATIAGVSESVTWSSEDGTVASVSASGVVTARTTGDIMVTATNSEGMKANCLVHVTKDVNGIALNKTATQITAGYSETLTYTLDPVDANEAVVWKSDNEAVATVDQNGYVSAKTKGTANIRVTTVTSNKTAVCTVTVVGQPISSLSLSSSYTVNVGTPYKLPLSISPSQYAGSVSWTSSNEAVATVAADGTVTGLAPGQTVITATSDNGKTATTTVTVKQPVTAMSFERSSITIPKGLSDKPVLHIEPANTTDTVSYSVSSTSYATVSSDGTVTAKNNVGTVTLTATASSGVKAYCTVYIVAPDVPVTSVTLDKSTLTLTQSDTVQLTAAVLPSDATNKALIWTTTDESIATVSNTGVVKATGAGAAIIRATATNGLFAECAVSVVSASGPSIVISNAKASVGETARITASIVQNPGIGAYKFTVSYNKNEVTPVSVTANPAFGGTLTTNLDDPAHTDLQVLWYNTNDVTADGDLFTVEFLVNDGGMQNGEYATINLTYKTTDICNVSGECFALYVKAGAITVADPLAGDIYEDGKITVYDLTLLARYITGLEVFTPRQQRTADVNDDDVVDIKDVVRLARYLVGYTDATLFAADEEKTADIVVGSAWVDENGIAEIPVFIENNPGIAGFRYLIDYDPQKSEILSITPNAALLADNFRTNLGEEGENGLLVTWYQSADMPQDGELFTIRARILDAETAKIGIVPADNNMCDEQSVTVQGTYTDGYIMTKPITFVEQQTDVEGLVYAVFADGSIQTDCAEVIAAFCDENGRLTETQIAQISLLQEKTKFTLTKPRLPYASVKLFVFDSLGTLKPLTEKTILPH